MKGDIANKDDGGAGKPSVTLESFSGNEQDSPPPLEIENHLRNTECHSAVLAASMIYSKRRYDVRNIALNGERQAANESLSKNQHRPPMSAQRKPR